MLAKLLYRTTILYIFLQARLNNSLDGLVPYLVFVVADGHHLFEHTSYGLRLKRQVECVHAVEHHAHRPYIDLDAVACILDYLWGHVCG